MLGTSDQNQSWLSRTASLRWAFLTAATLSTLGQAAVWTVDDDGVDLPDADFSVIQDAIDAAASGDTIMVYPGLYTSADDHVVKLWGKQLAVKSTSGPETTTLMQTGNYSVVSRNGSPQPNGVSLEGFTITGGQLGGIDAFFDLTVTNCIIQNNHHQNGAGGISHGGFGVMQISNCQILDNTGQFAGGIRANAISEEDMFIATDCTIRGNNVTSGDGRGAGLYVSSSNVTLNNCDISMNGPASGSGCYLGSGSTTFIDCKISGHAGDGLKINGSADAALAGTQVCDNAGEQIDGSWDDGGTNCIETLCITCDGEFEIPTDFPTIQAAIDIASPTLETTISVLPGTYTGDGDSVIDTLGKPVTIRSTAGASQTILDGENMRRVVNCSTYGDAVTIDGFTIQNGNALQGAGIYAIANPQIENCIITQNHCPASNMNHGGAGIYLEGSSASIANCQITDNTVTGDTYSSGGGIRMRGGSFLAEPSIYHCLISGNAAPEGAGISIGGDCRPYITQCDISTNAGRGLYWAGSSGPVVIFLCQIDANENGGIYAVNSDEEVVIFGTSISNNTGAPGIRLSGCSAVSLTTGTTVSDNDNYGIYMYGSTLSLAGTTITGNTAAVGIYSDASQIELLSTNSIADGIQTQRSTTNVAAQSSSQISRFIDFTVPYGGGNLLFDLDNPDGLFGLVVDEQLRQRGSLALSNTSGSLKNASPGDQFPLYVAQSQPYGFSSFITPVMPPGLGLVLVDAPPVRGDPTGAVAEVIAIETPEFDDPFSGTVDSPPVDLIALDADGDGDEDVAVLFDGTPGAVAAFDITESSEPVLIPSLVAQVGMAPILMDAADLDGDGDSDLLIANSGDNSITLLMLQGDGTFASTTIPATGGQITCAAAIDWDGDAYLDVVTGIDVAGPTSKDRFQIILDVADSPQTGPVFDIDLAGGQPDAPLTLTGGMAQDSWGFAGGTTFGRVLHANQATGVLALLGEQQGRVNRVIGKDIDDDGGDGQVDIIACSETAGELYIIPGNTGGFDEPIPLLTSLATTDFVVLDADRDGDEDFILASPTDPFEPLILLRNGGATRSRSMGGRTWGKQGLNGDGSPTRLTSGKLDPKDEQDDWVLGSGAATRRGGSQEGKIAQLTLSDFSCEGDVNQDGTVDLEDLLAVLDAWESQDPEMDVDGDGVITIDDILLLISIWGDCTT